MNSLSYTCTKIIKCLWKFFFVELLFNILWTVIKTNQAINSHSYYKIKQNLWTIIIVEKHNIFLNVFCNTDCVLILLIHCISLISSMYSRKNILCNITGYYTFSSIMFYNKTIELTAIKTCNVIITREVIMIISHFIDCRVTPLFVYTLHLT